MRPLAAFFCLVLLLPFCSDATAGTERAIGDTYYTDQNPAAPWEPIPVNPSEPDSGWQWVDPPWIPVVTPWPTLVIHNGSFRLFGMENEYRPYWHKMIYLSFEFDPTGDAVPRLLDAEWGYHPSHGVTSSYGDRVLEEVIGNQYRLQYMICPQPDWEILHIVCVGPFGDIYIIGDSVVFYSECGPPSTPTERSTWGRIKSLYR